jgi:FkbM family methyltransferase
MISEQNYDAGKMMSKNKLENFPSVYFISLEESIDRQQNIKNQFSEYGIIPIPILSKRFDKSDDVIDGKFLHQLNGGTAGTVVSHLKAIRKWYEETDEDYAFFCEDDLSLDTVQYWDFTWEEFVKTIPEDAMCVQLLVIRKDYESFDLRKRLWDDWAGTAYIITRDYAKILVEHYCLGKKRFHLELPESRSDIIPLSENVLFETLENICYAIPLFVEDIEVGTTFSPKEDKEVNGNQKNGHVESYKTVMDYWKNKMKPLTITKNNELSIEKNIIELLLEKYVNDPENAESNFNLAAWYWNENHTAPALSYFLRSAERSEDPTLAYESLLWSHQCYEKQGTRDHTARTLLQHAINLLPNRPEAYFLLAKFHRKREQWTDAYSISHQGLIFSEKNLEPLKNSVEYGGEYALLYEKALSGWWWGKGDETRKLLQEIENNYELPEHYKKSVQELLISYRSKISSKEVVSEFTYPIDFDWSDLTEEDIVTIEREIVHEKVYRFWNDVKEGDIVLDIGASVGAYTISILDQKPKKVYCVEPSKNFLKTLSKNCVEKLIDNPETSITYINHGVVSDYNDNINVFGNDKSFVPLTFNELIKKYSIHHINFMKIDCEGGEYSIFTDDNIDFLTHNVDFIAMEVHLKGNGFREKFKTIRDRYLSKFKNYKLISCTRQNISWGTSLDLTDKIFDNQFIDEYNCELMLYIDNKL